MNDFKVKYYQGEFIKIKLGNSHGIIVKAKPIYLLAIIDCIACKTLCVNEIHVDNKSLIEKYEKEYECYGGGAKLSPFILPFYHLSSSSFYTIKWCGQPFIPHPKAHSPSGLYLKNNAEYAKLDDDLWMLLQDTNNRELLRNQLIDFYFKTR